MSYGLIVKLKTRKEVHKESLERKKDPLKDDKQIKSEWIEIRFVNDYNTGRFKLEREQMKQSGSDYGTIYATNTRHINGKVVSNVHNSIVCIMKHTEVMLNYTYVKDTICFEEDVIFVISKMEDGFMVRKDTLILQVNINDLFSKENQEMREKQMAYVVCNGSVVSYHASKNACFVKELPLSPQELQRLDNKT